MAAEAGRRSILPRRRALTANLIIGVSIALFVCYLRESHLLEVMLAGLSRLSARSCLVLVANRLGYATTVPSLLGDAGCVLAAACIWTYLRSTAARIAASLALTVVLFPVALAVYRSTGVILTSPLIGLGVTLAIGAESVAESLSRRIHTRLLDEKQGAEFRILGHLNHSLKPNLQIARSPLAAVLAHLEECGMAGEPLGRRLDGSLETVGEALGNALLSLDQIGGILENTRKLVTHQIRREEFRELQLVRLLAEEVAPLYRDRLTLVVTGDPQLTLPLHRESLVEAFHNLIRNALTHGFRGMEGERRVHIAVRDSRKRVTIDYTNNGRPFPENLSAKEFLTWGMKSSDSPGEGLGGAWIGKVIEAHHGSFEVIRDEHPVHFRITLPRRGI